MAGPLALLALLLIAAGSPAGEPLPGEGAGGGKLRGFRAARILTMDGPEVSPGVLLLRGRLVERIVPGSEGLPPETEVTDLGRSVLLPGLVNPLSQVVAVGNFREGRPGAVSGGAGPPADVRALRAAESINPQSPALKRLGRSGYAALAVTPSGPGFLSGQAAVVRPRGAASREKTLIKESAYLAMTYGLGTPMREIAQRELGKAAAAQKKAREEREKAQKPPADAAKPKEPPAAGGPPPPPPDPLLQVFAGELPALVRVESPAALDHLFQILDKLPEPFPFILATPPLEPEGVEKVAARRKTIQAVVLEPLLSAYPDSTLYYNPARLFAEAGLEVALVPPTDDLKGHRNVLFALGELVKAGLSEEAALRAVTVTPAKLLRISDRVGSLAPGREASFLILDGDPLSARTRLLSVYLEGEEVYREDPSSGKARGEAVE
jgi:hypothetical protein